jgi:tetratricopeptide (TPR) repeat protein
VHNVVEGDVSGIVFQIGSINLPSPAVEKRTPRRIPSGPMRLVNRDDELDLLDQLLDQAETAPGPMVAVLSGMHGVGKSAVGNYWSTRVRDRFEGGDLFGDLSKRRRRGGVDVGDVLGEFIRQLGTGDVAIPPTLQDRTAMFRDLTASRRLLILLDDVGDAALVKPLLPAGAGSVVVVTSNSHLEELLYDGAELVPLEPLRPPTAMRLLSGMAGRERLGREPEAAERLVELCGGLPVALCVCGATLKVHRNRAIASFVTEIEEESKRLGGLSGKGEASIEGVLDFAYSDLDATEVLIYRRLGLHPGPDFGPVQASVLAAVPVDLATASLDLLVDRHLVEPSREERNSFHDLVRIHARACAEQDDSEAEREAAIRRLVDWYYAALRKADRVLTADRLRLAEELPIPAASLPEFADRAEVFAWLDQERANVLAVFRAAVAREWDDRIWQMAEALWLFFYNRKPFSDWIEVLSAAIESAQRRDDAAVEAGMRSQLARAHMDLRQRDLADRELTRSEEVVARSGHEKLAASIREFRGAFYEKYGHYDEAVEEFEGARRAFEELGEERGVAIQVYRLG